jgi:hypothetical protein
MKPRKRTSQDSTLSSKVDKYLYKSLIGQCFNVFIQAQRVWKYYANGFPSPYDEKKGRLLQPKDIPACWIEDSYESHEDLMKKTLESIYEGKFCQKERDHGLLLFKWYSKSSCRFLSNTFKFDIETPDKKKGELFQRFGDVDLDRRIEVAVNQARNEIFGRKQNGGTLTDGEIIACFAMHEVLDSKFLLQSPNVLCQPPALREEELNVARAILEMAKSGCGSEKPVQVESKRIVGEQDSDGKDKNFSLYKKTPENAKWQDLTMAFPNHLEDKVDIHFKGKQRETVSLNDLGFTDSKATKTFKPLESLTLLKRFAEAENNCIASQSKDNERKKLHAQVESLRNVLKQYFGIDGDPVPANDEGGYRLQFKACCYDIKEKKELDTYLDSINGYFSELKTEANNTETFRDNNRIKDLEELIKECAKEIIQRIPETTLKDAVCTGCYARIPSCILNRNNITILCSDCMSEATNEYESKSVVDYKENDIPRSDSSS